MILSAVVDEMFATLDAADIGLNVPGRGGSRRRPPAPYIELPDIVYGAGGPGLHRIDDLGLLIKFGPANNEEVFKLALDYASTGGPKSIKTTLEAHHWVACGTVFVARAEPTIEGEMGNNPALGYTFHIQITGG